MINIYYYSVSKLIFIIFGAASAIIKVRYFVNLKALWQTIETAPETTFKARKPTRFVTFNPKVRAYCQAISITSEILRGKYQDAN